MVLDWRCNTQTPLTCSVLILTLTVKLEPCDTCRCYVTTQQPCYCSSWQSDLQNLYNDHSLLFRWRWQLSTQFGYVWYFLTTVSLRAEQIFPKKHKYASCRKHKGHNTLGQYGYKYSQKQRQYHFGVCRLIKVYLFFVKEIYFKHILPRGYPG